MQADDAHDIDVVMPMYNLIEYSYIFSMFILYIFNVLSILCFSCKFINSR